MVKNFLSAKHHIPIFALLKLIASHRSQGSLTQLAVVFHHEERLIEKQGPDERSDIVIQI